MPGTRKVPRSACASISQWSRPSLTSSATGEAHLRPVARRLPVSAGEQASLVSFVLIDPSALSRHDVYKLLIGSVVPRPIAWVSSVSAAGDRNLAPFSFFTVVSTVPPMLSITLERRLGTGELKDTLENVQQTDGFVVNVVSVPLA